MSSLYRCRARVGYRPFGSDKLILFDEKQIQELNVKLKWQPGLLNGNADRSTEASVGTNALNQSTCSVTISDPYLTGLAWPVLFDTASLYSQSTIAAANNIILPPCSEGQDPNVDKCFKYPDIEGDESSGLGQQNFAFLLVSLWYDVKGTSFGTDFYFRVSGFSVSHGTRYPSVTVRGVEARSVLFNQSLVNTTLEEGVEIEKALKDLAEQLGYSVSFCVNTNNEPEKKRLLPRTIRYTGVTTDEVIKKVLNSVGGNSLSLPTREYANRISMCSRGEINQGCSVFYLGKGLYEGYEISGQPELTLIGKNYEWGSNRNNGDPYVSEPFKAQTYFIGDIAPNKRKKAMENVKKLAFPEQFKPVPKHIKNTSTTTGYVWRDSQPASANKKGIQVINEEATKIDKNGINLFGIAPNGTTAISFLEGEVVEAGGANGRVLIKTKFSLQICEKEGSQKCFFRRVFQESTGLESIKVKPKDALRASQEIGSSTTAAPEFVRFFINGYGTGPTTLNPKIVWDWAFPEGEVPRQQTPAVTSGQPNNQPAKEQVQPSAGEVSIGRVGSTGRSSGPHIHFQFASGTVGGSEAKLLEVANKYFVVGGVPMGRTQRGDGYGAGRGHRGIDFQPANRTPIYVTNGATIKSVNETKCTRENSLSDDCGDGFGNYVTVSTPDGDVIVAHLAPQSIPPNLAGLTTASGGGKPGQGIQSSPSVQGLTLETSFKGVPRALRIIPGRTILSFISNYDEWVEQGRPKNIDPGVWIADRFKNWFISECQYRWREGDLRVELQGVSAWGTVKTPAPTFDKYLEGMRKSGDIKISKDYYDYIRSIGELNWKTENGKDSTEVYCKEAQDLSRALSQGGDSTSPTDTQGSYPQGDCKTGDATKDAVINALYSAGLRTPNAFAGVLGNFQKESGINFDVHNGARPGSGCSGTRSNVLGAVGYGLAQWCGSRADNLANRYKCGRNCSLAQQLNFLVYELQGYKGMISQMNNAKSAGDAAIIFRRDFERPRAADSPDRREAAEQIVKQIKCSKPS